MNILVLNPGSSSLKFGLYQCDAGPAGSAPHETVLLRGAVENIGRAETSIQLATPDGQPPDPVRADSASAAAKAVLERLAGGHYGAWDVQAVACRVVHGGVRFTQPARVTAETLDAICGLSSLAPLHNPVDAEVIAAASAALPAVDVFAVFDTAFHHTLPETAYTYALPWELCREHQIRRYGFHGISHRYASERLVEALGGTAAGTRLITCHLGSGASVCALRDGRSVETSMGLTPLEGLVMGTRCGDVDPGLLLYLQRRAGLTPESLDEMLNRHSGLAGISGRSDDVRELTAAAGEGDARAELALDVFSHRVRKYIGAYVAVLGGLDAVAFTGGIGEHSATIRQRVCLEMSSFGIQLDEARNTGATGHEMERISTPGALAGVWVIPADEERQMAREVSCQI